MKQIIFSVYDKIAHAYLPPFFLPNGQMAKRTFADCINDPNHAFSLHPEDYTLYEHGSFENTTGMLTIYTENTKLGNGLEYVFQENELNEGEIAGDRI